MSANSTTHKDVSAADSLVMLYDRRGGCTGAGWPDIKCAIYRIACICGILDPKSRSCVKRSMVSRWFRDEVACPGWCDMGTSDPSLHDPSHKRIRARAV